MFGSSEMVIVLVIVLVLFGGSQLPKLAKNLGKAQKEFKDGLDDANKSDKSDETAKGDASTAPEVASAKNDAAAPPDPSSSTDS